jgi:outer membrane biosynthesis protein TonB
MFMVSALALWFALSAAQATTPPAPQTAEPPAAGTAPPTQSLAQKRAANAQKPCAPGPNGTYEGALGMKWPITIYMPDPDFPSEARKYKINLAWVNLIVDEKGHPTNVHPLRRADATADPKLQDALRKVDQSAVDAVQKYRFQPGTCDGRKVPIELNIQIDVEPF